MKIAVQYLSDSEGKTTAVQLSLTEWERVVSKLRKLEQTLKLKTDISEAFVQLSDLKKSKTKKMENLKDFLNEL